MEDENDDAESNISLDEFEQSIDEEDIIDSGEPFDWNILRVFNNKNIGKLDDFKGSCKIEKEIRTPIESFLHFFDKEVINLIVTETNIYGR